MIGARRITTGETFMQQAQAELQAGEWLARLQARRLVAERPEIAFVDTRDEALAWVLASGDAAPRAA